MLLPLVAVLTQCSLQFEILILFAYDVGVLVKCHQSGFYRTCSKLSIRQTFSFRIFFHLCGYFCVCQYGQCPIYLWSRMTGRFAFVKCFEVYDHSHRESSIIMSTVIIIVQIENTQIKTPLALSYDFINVDNSYIVQANNTIISNWFITRYFIMELNV